MGLFGGLIKDSPLTFWVNAGKSAKGRVAKGRGRRSRRAQLRSEPVEYRTPREELARLGGTLAVLGCALPIGGYWLGGISLVTLGLILLLATARKP